MSQKVYLVLAAQKEELDGLFSSIESKVTFINGLETHVFENPEVKIYGLMSGIGKVSMALTMGIFLATVPVNYVINIGVAGSISSQLRKMQTFVSKKVCYWDVDLKEFGHPVGQMSDCPLYFEADRELLAKAERQLQNKGKAGLIISGDSFVSKAKIKEDWFKEFDNPIACDMESAAVAQVCYKLHIPFLIIRAISDDPVNDGDNKDVYEFNLNEASYEAGKLVYKVIFD